jgi:hypothetical protein
MATCKRKQILNGENVFGFLRSTAIVHKVSRLGLLKALLEHIFPELPNFYLSGDIKPVSELYGQGLITRLYCHVNAPAFGHTRMHVRGV